MLDLMALFGTDRELLATRGSFIIRNLCTLLEAEKLYRAFAGTLAKDKCKELGVPGPKKNQAEHPSTRIFLNQGILLHEDDLEFAPLMVQNLNLILLTAPELFNLRKQLMAMATDASRSLFVELYKSWCHSAVATLSLCLLTQVYDHACDLLDKFAQLDVTVELLVEVRRFTTD